MEIQRRTAMKILGGVSVASLPAWLRASSDATASQVDVLVVGGGTAGTVAAYNQVSEIK